MINEGKSKEAGGLTIRRADPIEPDEGRFDMWRHACDEIHQCVPP